LKPINVAALGSGGSSVASGAQVGAVPVSAAQAAAAAAAFLPATHHPASSVAAGLGGLVTATQVRAVG